MIRGERFIPYVTTRTFADPTAERAIELASRHRHVRSPNENSPAHTQREPHPQAAIDGAIHNLRIELAAERISNAFYRENMDMLLRQRRNIQKEGRK